MDWAKGVNKPCRWKFSTVCGIAEDSLKQERSSLIGVLFGRKIAWGFPGGLIIY